MNDSRKLLRDIQKYDFALQETALYLDNHTTDKDALKYFSYFRGLAENARKEYARTCGPLQYQDQQRADFWLWASGPWPWEGEG